MMWSTCCRAIIRSDKRITSWGFAHKICKVISTKAFINISDDFVFGNNFLCSCNMFKSAFIIINTWISNIVYKYICSSSINLSCAFCYLGNFLINSFSILRRKCTNGSFENCLVRNNIISCSRMKTSNSN